MPEYRSEIQRDANNLDLEVFRVAESLQRFAEQYRQDDAREMAATIRALRWRIRRHMHPKDREATS